MTSQTSKDADPRLVRRTMVTNDSKLVEQGEFRATARRSSAGELTTRTFPLTGLVVFGGPWTISRPLSCLLDLDKRCAKMARRELRR